MERVLVVVRRRRGDVDSRLRNGIFEASQCAESVSLSVFVSVYAFLLSSTKLNHRSYRVQFSSSATAPTLLLRAATGAAPALYSTLCRFLCATTSHWISTASTPRTHTLLTPLAALFLFPRLRSGSFVLFPIHERSFILLRETSNDVLEVEASLSEGLCKLLLAVAIKILKGFDGTSQRWNEYQDSFS